MTALIRIFISIFLAVVLFTTDFGMGINGKKENKAQAEDTVDEAVSEQSDEDESEEKPGFLNSIVDKISGEAEEAISAAKFDVAALSTMEKDDERIGYIEDYVMTQLKTTKQEEAVISEKDILDGVDDKCTKAEYFETYDWKESIFITSYVGNDEYVIIPNRINDKPVIRVDSRAFENNTSLKMCVLPEGCTSIGSYAFSGCRRLEKVVSDPFLIKIESMAFLDCDSLEGFEAVPLEDNTTESVFLARETNGPVFRNCVSMTYFTFGSENGIKDVFDEVYIDGLGGLEKLERVVLPFGPSCRIQNSAFIDDPALREVINSEGITYICGNAFENCPSLQSMPLPCVTRIESDAFMGCSSIKTVVLSGAINRVDGYSYLGCSSLATLLFDEEGVDENGKCDNYLALFESANSVTEELDINEVKERFNRWDFSKIYVKGSDGAGIYTRAFEATALQTVTVPWRYFLLEDIFNECTNLTSFTWETTEYNKADQELWPYFENCNLKELNLPGTLAKADRLKRTLELNPECVVKVPAGSNAEKLCIEGEIPYVTE